MKFLYVTDLHGHHEKYKKVLAAAKRGRVQAVVNGGDMLPKSGALHDQLNFMFNFMDKQFQAYEEAKIHYLCMMGNDDIKAFDPDFQELCNRYKYVHNIAFKKTIIDTYEFIGFNLVPDYPFTLKDRCRKDMQQWRCPKQLGKAITSNREGFDKISHWFDHVSSLPTIKDELQNLPKPKSFRKAIYVIHCPPALVGLDECMRGERVGSFAVHKFIEKKQPLLTLHGHIHEGPYTTGLYSAHIGNTLCIQPGQMQKLTYVSIVVEKGKVNYRIRKLSKIGERGLW